VLFRKGRVSIAGKTAVGIDELLDAIVNASPELETQTFYDHITGSAAKITRAHSSVLVLRGGESDVTMYVSAFKI
jgi:hypothetical protein